MVRFFRPGFISGKVQRVHDDSARASRQKARINLAETGKNLKTLNPDFESPFTDYRDGKNEYGDSNSETMHPAFVDYFFIFKIELYTPLLHRGNADYKVLGK